MRMFIWYHPHWYNKSLNIKIRSIYKILHLQRANFESDISILRKRKITRIPIQFDATKIRCFFPTRYFHYLSFRIINERRKRFSKREFIIIHIEYCIRRVIVWIFQFGSNKRQRKEKGGSLFVGKTRVVSFHLMLYYYHSGVMFIWNWIFNYFYIVNIGSSKE